MNKDVMIRVTSEIVQDGSKDNIEFTTEGKFYHKNGKDYLKYEESKLSGMEGNTVILIIESDKVIMNRYGVNKSKMEFMKDHITFTDYRTAYGNFEMEIQTTRLDVNLNEGYLKIEYDIEVKGLSNGKNKLLIEIK